MPKITIRVGAAADASLRNAYLPLIAAAKLARQQVAAQMSGMATAQIRESERASRAQARAANEGARDAYRAQKAANDALLRERQRATNFEMREFDKRVRASKRASDAEERDIIRVARAAERAEERKARAAKSAADAKRRSVRSEFPGRAVSGVSSIYDTTKRFAGDVVGGMGVDLSVSSNIAKSVSLESTATRATNSGFIAKGKAATTKDVNETVEAVRKAADATSSDYNRMALGLEAFTSKTGDLDAGKASLLQLAKIARATGTDVNDMLAASGDVWRQISDGPGTAEEKYKQLGDIMRLTAKQGAMGNVEIKDLAVEMSKVVGGAFQYSGNRDKNIGTLGALAQLSMSGGNAVASEGARSAAAFGRDITKSSSLKRFDKAGIEVFADKGHTKLRDPVDIIKDTLRKTKGDLGQMSNLFQNQMSMSVMKGAGKIYSDAGGGEAGIAAVEKEFKKFAETIEEGDLEAAFKTEQATREAAAQRFNNQMQRIADSLATNLLPQLEKAAPHIAKFATAVAGLAAWAAANPFKAVAAALGASILKAGIETAIKDGITQLLKGGGGAPGGGGGGLPVVAAGAAGFALGTWIEGIFAEKQSNAENENVMGGLATGTIVDRLKLKDAGLYRGTALMEKASLEARIARAQAPMGVRDVIQNMGMPISFLTGGKSFDEGYSERNDRENIALLQTQLSEIAAAIEVTNSRLAGGIPVTVSNLVGALVDQASRVGPSSLF